MNLKSTFAALFGRQETGIATVGKKVFYDAKSGRILGEAPAHRVTDSVL